jgi:DNA-directed RNA polymerase specialized sigma24 family protein
MSRDHSMTNLIRDLQAGRSSAAQAMWDRCIARLVNGARQKLRGLPRRAADEEDVALAAFDAFLRGVKENRFAKLENREDLWQVLGMLSERRAIAERRHERADKRGGGNNRGESVFEQAGANGSAAAGIDQVGDPNPAMIDLFTLEVRELLEILDDQLLRKIAILRLEGYINKDIAGQLGIAMRAVERKLQLIRQKWHQESQS